jgi:hypothetical protein
MKITRARMRTRIIQTDGRLELLELGELSSLFTGLLF